LTGHPLWSPKAGPLLVVSPHPDDEVLGAGGLIRRWSAQGHRVVVLSVTDGEAAYPGWPGLNEIRRRELDRALEVLCDRPVSTIRLALEDGAVRRRIPALIGALECLCAGRPTVVAPFEADGHPDHEAVAFACLQVAGTFELPLVRYPIWAWHHAAPDAFQGVRWGKFPLDAATLAAKRAAMQCFASQLRPGEAYPPGVAWEPIVPRSVLDYFSRDYEAFLV
jgi:LmbE family N-acetylglucosaminyl deacetylase